MVKVSLCTSFTLSVISHLLVFKAYRRLMPCKTVGGHVEVASLSYVAMSVCNSLDMIVCRWLSSPQVLSSLSDKHTYEKGELRNFYRFLRSHLQEALHQEQVFNLLSWWDRYGTSHVTALLMRHRLLTALLERYLAPRLQDSFCLAVFPRYADQVLGTRLVDGAQQWQPPLHAWEYK
jgi:hypothetical protein